MKSSLQTYMDHQMTAIRVHTQPLRFQGLKGRLEFAEQYQGFGTASPQPFDAPNQAGDIIRQIDTMLRDIDERQFYRSLSWNQSS